MSRKEWVQNWGRMSDGDLENAARYYLWLSAKFPDLHTVRLGEILEEIQRRGKPEILRQAQASIAPSKQEAGHS